MRVQWHAGPLATRHQSLRNRHLHRRLRYTAWRSSVLVNSLCLAHRTLGERDTRRMGSLTTPLGLKLLRGPTGLLECLCGSRTAGQCASARALPWCHKPHITAVASITLVLVRSCGRLCWQQMVVLLLSPGSPLCVTIVQQQPCAMFRAAACHPLNNIVTSPSRQHSHSSTSPISLTHPIHTAAAAHWGHALAHSPEPTAAHLAATRTRTATARGSPDSRRATTRPAPAAISGPISRCQARTRELCCTTRRTTTFTRSLAALR